MLDGIDDVITGHDTHTQTRQVSVYHKVAATGAGVTVIVGHTGAHRNRTVTQRGQVSRGQRYAPSQVTLYAGGVSLAAQDNSDGIARSRTGHRTVQSLACIDFGDVQHVVAGQRLDVDNWPDSVH
ncbi:hypothetical protein D3C79_454310 [compost metagenome]